MPVNEEEMMVDDLREVPPMELAFNLTAELLDALTGPGYCVLCDHAPKRGVRIVDSVAEHNHDCVAASVRNRLMRMRARIAKE